MSKALDPVAHPRGLRSIDLGRAVDLALAGAIGALCGLYLDVELVAAEAVWVRDAWAGLAIGASSGYCLSAAPAARDGAWLKAARDAGRGAIAGGIGGAVGLVIGEAVLGLFQGGLVGRAVSWAILGFGIGAGLGLVRRSRQSLLFGVVGGSVGGLVGGFSFEAMRLRMGDRHDLGQGVGIVLLGAGLGLSLSLVEQTLRFAWVRVIRGRQEGRDYSLTKPRNALGLDEKAEVGLFGDPTVARRHAEIVVEGRDYVLVNLDPKNRTTVNGQVVKDRQGLRDGDAIDLGQTSLRFRRR